MRMALLINFKQHHLLPCHILQNLVFFYNAGRIIKGSFKVLQTFNAVHISIWKYAERNTLLICKEQLSSFLFLALLEMAKQIMLLF